MKDQDAKKTEKHRADPALPQPPDGGYGWVVVIAAFLINVIVDGIAYSYGVFNRELQTYYNSGSGVTSMVGSLLNALYLTSSPLASVLINRYDSRYVTIAGALIATFGFGVSQLSPNVKVMMLTFGVIGGFGFGMMYLPAVVSVSFYFEKRRALTTGIVTCGTGVGCFLFAPLFQAVLSANGWQYAMVVLAGISLQGAVCGALLRPLKAPSPKQKKPTQIVRSYQVNDGSDPPHNVSADPDLQSVREAKEKALRKEEEEEDLGVSTGNGEKKELSSRVDVEQQEEVRLSRRSSAMASSLASLPVVVHGSCINISRGSIQPPVKRSFLQSSGLDMLTDPLFLIPILANLVAMLGHYIPFFFIAQRSILMLECTEARAALLMSVIAVTNTLGRVLMGFLADFKSVNALLLHNIAIASSGAACILSMFCVNYASTCIFAAYFGLCMATWISLSPIILCELLGLEKLTNSFGILCCVRGISAFAGPPLAGWVYDVTQNYNNAFHVGGILLILGGSINFLLHLPYFQRRTYANRMLAQQKQEY